MKITDLKLNLQNPRRIKDARFKKLCNSIKDFPKMMELRPIVIDRSNGNMILGGNMRYRALKELGYKEIPDEWVKDAADLTDAEKRRFIVEDNMPFGEWDMDILANSFDTSDLVEWGFDEKELGILPDLKDAEPQIDRAEELNKKWQVKTGDLWQIGEHRLLCGDSTRNDDFKIVVNGNKAIVFSDAPYGVNIVSTNKATGSIGFGRKLGFVGADGIVPVNAYHPIKGDETTETAEKFYRLCLDNGLGDFILWGGNYFTDFLPPSPCWIVWDKREEIPSNNFADCEIAWTSFDRPSRIYRHLWSGLLRKGNRKDESVSRLHPTQKPVGLTQNIMQDFQAEYYLDGFLGSGTTMVACQNLNRKCRAIEISPAYCAVTLERMATAFPELKIERR